MAYWYRQYRLWNKQLTVNGQIQNHGGDFIINLVSGTNGDTSTGWPSVPSGLTYSSNSAAWTQNQTPPGSYVKNAAGTTITSGANLPTNYKPYIVFYSTGSVFHVTNLSFSIYYKSPNVTAGNPIYASEFTVVGQSATKGNVISNGNFTKGAVIKASDWNAKYFVSYVF